MGRKRAVAPALTVEVSMHFEVAIPNEDKQWWDMASEAERHQYLEERISCEYCDVGVTVTGTTFEGDKRA